MSLCADCKKQQNASRRAEPHSNLSQIDQKIYRNIPTGGYEETEYKCQLCKSTVYHTNDKYEVQHWTVVETTSKNK